MADEAADDPLIKDQGLKTADNNMNVTVTVTENRPKSWLSQEAVLARRSVLCAPSANCQRYRPMDDGP